MGLVVIAVGHAPYQRKVMLTRRAVFANHLPRIVVLNGNSDSTGCVRGGRRSMPSFFFFNAYGYFL